MANFITNSQGTDLRSRLVELVRNSKDLKFLVGFFYFSGIRELYQGLKDNPDVTIKVLVGLNVDKAAHGLLEYADSDNCSDYEKSYKFIDSVQKSLTSSDFDTKEFYEQVRYFIQLIKDDKLIIRKSYVPNHAKLYFFNLKDDQVGRQTIFVTGSSNLTKAGLSTQEEFNVEISDYGTTDTEGHFDALWEEGVKITEDKAIKEQLISVVEKKSLVKELSPFEAFVLVLKTYIESFDQKEISQSLTTVLHKAGYIPYQYQLDAVRQGLAMIENNNGVIIADVVGLGKTIVACSLGVEMKKRGLVICPPGLMGDNNKKSGWKMYLEQFQLYHWEVRSLGDLENTAEYIKRTKDIEIIVADEAHRFRNQDTKDYELLRNICRDKSIILLTATPFNNKPSDILALLKLFITPKKSNISLDSNLVDKFKSFSGLFDRLSHIKKYYKSSNESNRKKAESYYQALFGSNVINLSQVDHRSKYLSKQIRDVIEPIMIRRNRLDLEKNPNYKSEVGSLAKISDPLEWFFDLTKEQSAFYDKILTDYFADPDEGGRFKGAIYRPFEYEKGLTWGYGEKLNLKDNFEKIQQRNLFDFMRRLLVKRFESSFGSFEQSILRFRNITNNALEFIEKSNEYIMDRPLLEKIYTLDVEEIEQKLDEFAEKLRNGDYPKKNRIYHVDKFVDRDKFISHIKSDLAMFDAIIEDLSAMKLVEDDPKSKCLAENVLSQLSIVPENDEPKRKVLIFSEYLDTVNHLETALRPYFGNKLLVVNRSLSDKVIAEINQNFDASSQNQLDDYDVILATDKISEGFNLNRAGMVVNYDIPWNPVRVIQRVGRINRISKKVFDRLFIVNFFPTEKGSEYVKSREIAQNKMFLIHNVLGEDSKIFDIDEEPTAAGLYDRLQQNPDEMEQESFYTKVLNDYTKIDKENPGLIESLNNFPKRVKVAKSYTDNELLVFFQKGRMYSYGISNNGTGSDQPYQIMMEDAFDKICCKKEEKRLPLSKTFWGNYEKIKNYREYQVAPLSEQSLEQRSINNIKSILQNPWSEVMPHIEFVRVLLEDILNYGTLPDYTLRRIANLEVTGAETGAEVVLELANIRVELGDDYLQKEKGRQTDIEKEVIIAIDNQHE